MSTTGRIAEAAALAEAGADELDIAINIGLLKSGQDRAFAADIAAIVQAAAGCPIKVMLELPLLTLEERERAIRLSQDAGARYLKNASSGAVGTASPEEMRFLRAHARPSVGVKASGGIRTRAQVLELLAAGADLVGTTAALRIVAADDAAGRAQDTGSAY